MIGLSYCQKQQFLIKKTYNNSFVEYQHHTALTMATKKHDNFIPGEQCHRQLLNPTDLSEMCTLRSDAAVSWRHEPSDCLHVLHLLIEFLEADAAQCHSRQSHTGLRRPARLLLSAQYLQQRHTAVDICPGAHHCHH